MIIEALLQLVVALFNSLLSFLGGAIPAAPGWWLEIGAAVDTVLGSVGAPVRHFLPLAPLVTAGMVLWSLQLSLGGLRLARRIVSLFTGGGGSA